MIARARIPSSKLRTVVVIAVAALAIGVEAACARGQDDGLIEPSGQFAQDSGQVATGLCVQTECPAPWATCPGEQGLCTTDTSRDIDHCGSCETPCKKPSRSEHASAVCTGGKCNIACEPLYADCNKNEADGCETPTDSDPKNCGSCGTTCAEGDPCWRGACGCPKGFTLCGTECVQLDSDDKNCGACGQECAAPSDPTDSRWRCGPKVVPDHTKFKCAEAACTQQCSPGWGNCNHLFCPDGCETDLMNDPMNCGACRRQCEEGQACVRGDCICPAGTVRCGDKCVDVNVDPRNCGRCGNMCPGPASFLPGQTSTGGPSCNGGRCGYVCAPGFADCNNRIFDGCEVNLTNDPKNCGSCGTQCNLAAGQPCVQGKCLTKSCDEAGVVF